MPLTPALAEVKLSKVDQKTSAKLILPGSLTTAQNVVMTQSGRYDRRSGTSLLTTISGARNIQDHNRELLIGTADTLYSRFASADNARGVLTSFDTRSEPVNNTPFEQTSHDMVITNGQEWSVWRDSRSGIRYSVRNVATGAYVVSEGVIVPTGGLSGDMVEPRVWAVGTNILVTYYLGDVSGTTTFLYGRKIAVATPTSVGAEVEIDDDMVPGGTGLDSFAGYDGVVYSATEIVLAYISNGTSDERVRLRLWDVGTMTSTTVLTEAADRGPGKGGIALIGSSGGYYVAHAQGDSTNLVRLLIAASDLSSFTTTATAKTYGAAVTLRSVTGFVDGSGNAFILVTRMVTSGATTRPAVDYMLRNSNGTTQDINTFHGSALASHAFTSGGSRYVLMNMAVEQPTGINTRSSHFIVNLGTGSVVGRIHSSVAAVPTPNRGTARILPAVQTTSTGFAVATGYRISTTQLGASISYFDPSSRKRWVESSGVTVIPGSWPRIYDGLGVTELGFEAYPHRVNATQSGASGLANGTYYYRMTWYWVDATGRIHESEPSPAESFTVTGGPRAVTLTVETLQATNKTSTLDVQDPVLRVYRTEVNPSEEAVASFFLVGITTNDLTAATIQFIDTTTDADLVDGELLYTAGQTVLENTPTSPMTSAAAWNQRFWSTDKDTLYFSKLLEDTQGIRSNDTQFITVSDSYGDFVALADGGSRLLAFKQGAIYSITGSGPSNTGEGDFQVVDRLELPLGSKSQFGVLSTEVGVFFQDYATSQIWLLGDAGAEYIGAPIETLMSGLTVVDTVQVGRQIRFYTSNGTTLVYDLFHKQWTWFTGQAAACAGVIDGVAHYALASTGAVRYDDSSVWTEAGTTYQAVLETGWMSFAGLSGHQRTYTIVVLGDAPGSHTLSIKPSFKFGTGTYTQTLASASLGATHAFRVEAPVKLAYQRSTSIKIRLEDSSPSTAGFNLEALVLDVGIDRKIARLPAANRAT
jgi:hypothetical protein